MLLACTLCQERRDVELRTAVRLATTYVAHAVMLALATSSPDAVLPRLLERSREAAPIGMPVRTRAHLRGFVLAALSLAFLAEMGTVLFAPQLIVRGRWEHVRGLLTQWHANLHIVRHLFLLLLAAYVGIRARWRMPDIKVAHALGNLAALARAQDSAADNVRA